VRTEDFVTYLYGEATPEEAGAFRLHLEACGVCREELAALGGVREAVGDWRAEALGTLPALNIAGAFAPAADFGRPRARQRSAAAALREFFSLSPLWLRAGAVAATLAVCALAALTLARAEVSWGADGFAFRTGVPERVVVEQSQPRPAPPQPAVYTEEQVKAIVERRVAEATALLAGQLPSKVVEVSDGGVGRRTPAAKRDARRHKRAAGPVDRREEQLLAADDLPRLSDLLGDSY
jgi:anti-sigma factor RsiW